MICDIKRGITEPMFRISLSLVTIILVISGVYYFQGTDIYTSDGAFRAIQSFILPFIAPLIVCLPFSNMSMIERESGYDKLMLNRISHAQYVYMRFISNAIVGGLTLFIPLLVTLGLCRLIGEYANFIELLEVVGLNFLFGSSYATISYGLTFFNDKNYIPCIAPQVMYLLLTYAIPYLNLDKYYPPLAFSPWLLSGVSTTESILIHN